MTTHLVQDLQGCVVKRNAIIVFVSMECTARQDGEHEDSYASLDCTQLMYSSKILTMCRGYAKCLHRQYR